MDSNILIRTALLRGRDISFQAGGGIVADSQPPVEYEETLNKARGLALALGEDIDRFAALASPAPVSEQAG
jgi:anthranilate/para-aminobenzoate synthase component I